MIAIPNLEGLSVLEAESITKSEGIQVVVADTIFTNDINPGIILEQFPAAGREVKLGRAIKIKITQFNQKILVPELLGKTLRAYFLYSWIQEKNNKKKYLLYFILSCGIAFLIASHIYYPSLDYLSNSIRAGGENHYQYATNWSMHPKELLTYILPNYYGFGGSSYNGYMPFTDYPNYVGFFVLLSALYSLIKLNSNKIFFASILLLSVLLSFGKYFNLIYDFFYSFFPYFSNFRVRLFYLY